MAQGSKEVGLGDSRYQYDPLRYLLVTVDLPVTSQVVEASRERPYLSFRLNQTRISSARSMVEADYAVSPREAAVARAIDVAVLDANLLEAVVRLVRLVDTPVEAPVLMPSIVRDRLSASAGKQGRRLHHLAVTAARTPSPAQCNAFVRSLISPCALSSWPANWV